MPVCVKCGIDKPEDAFSKDRRHRNGLQSRCKTCVNEYQRAYAQTPKRRALKRGYNTKYKDIHRDEVRRKAREYNKQYRAEKAEVIKERSQSPVGKGYQKRYYMSDKGRTVRAAREREKWKSDPAFKMMKLVRHRIRQALKGAGKSRKTVELLGCSIEDAMHHLESLFRDGMTWDNHGEWHIDHVIPLASFDLTDEAQLMQACHYTNLQPLWSHENFSKRDKLDFEVARRN